MPFPNEHAARVENPDGFDSKSFRRKTIAPGVTIIIGKKTGSDTMTTQSYRFSKDKFTPEQAKKWLKDHEVKNMGFEQAAKAKEQQTQKIASGEVIAEGDGTIRECSDYLVPFGVKSFSDLESYRQTKEAAEDLNELVSNFQQLASNIVNDFMVEDKKAALASLVEEFVSMLNIENAMSDEEIAAREGAPSGHRFYGNQHARSGGGGGALGTGSTNYAAMGKGDEPKGGTPSGYKKNKDGSYSQKDGKNSVAVQKAGEDRFNVKTNAGHDADYASWGDAFGAADEFLDTGDLAEAFAEAATVKANAKAAIKALEGLLTEKTLPKKLLGQIEEMKGALRRTWKDLEDEKKLEDIASPDNEEEACKDKKKMKEDDVESLAESYAGVLDIEILQEAESSLLEMDVQLIRPGWGNKRDGHYYPAEMLKSYAEKFVGAKMYETDHKQAEKSTRSWVSTVKEIKGYADDGAPIARVAVHDPNFAERVRNLKEAKLLDRMECSILADGTARVGEIAGKKGKIVESITDVSSVDWVTRAGAGGHALALAESSEGGSDMEKVKDVLEETASATTETATTPESVAEAGEATTQPTRLNEAQVQEVLAKSKLPEASKERLCEGEYSDEAKLQEAVTKEIAYVKKITGSGQPFGIGDTKAPQAEKLSEADIESRKQGVMKRYGLG